MRSLPDPTSSLPIGRQPPPLAVSSASASTCSSELEMMACVINPTFLPASIQVVLLGYPSTIACPSPTAIRPVSPRTAQARL